MVMTLFFLSGTLLASGNFARLANPAHALALLGTQQLAHALGGAWAAKFTPRERIRRGVVYFSILGLLGSVWAGGEQSLLVFFTFGICLGTGGAFIHSAALEISEASSEAKPLFLWLTFGAGGAVAGLLQQLLIKDDRSQQMYLAIMGCGSLFALVYARRQSVDVSSLRPEKKYPLFFSPYTDGRSVALLSLAGLVCAFTAASYGRVAQAQGIPRDRAVWLWQAGHVLNGLGRYIAKEVTVKWKFELAATAGLVWLSLSLTALSSRAVVGNLAILPLFACSLGLGLVAGATQKTPLHVTTPAVVLGVANGLSCLLVVPAIFQLGEARQVASVVAALPLVACSFVGLS